MKLKKTTYISLIHIKNKKKAQDQINFVNLKAKNRLKKKKMEELICCGLHILS